MKMVYIDNVFKVMMNLVIGNRQQSYFIQDGVQVYYRVMLFSEVKLLFVLQFVIS